MDSTRFDGLAQTFAEREEGAGNREQFEALTRLIAAKGSRRVALAGLVGTVFAGPRADGTDAQCRSKKGKNKRRCRDRDGGLGDPACGVQDKLFGLCPSPAFNWTEKPACCGSMICINTLDPFVWACQQHCATDDDCQKAFPGHKLACRIDALVCPIEALLGGKCCVPK